ncbi:hypothetical protein Pyn_34985 [Prunus yedoensis var. nudiflora]|uniref:Uncharacterized protein n=1 Tax=Prunus yedoensis var. nudiflora TaxID=2094558 RepID=A0A314UFT0_PRUYE|nr:hypothetical protein Pyn_34985 [Prunus yedoensis var. nudiflora]
MCETKIMDFRIVDSSHKIIDRLRGMEDSNSQSSGYDGVDELTNPLSRAFPLPPSLSFISSTQVYPLLLLHYSCMVGISS